jgi:serine/threonine protein kinase
MRTFKNVIYIVIQCLLVALSTSAYLENCLSAKEFKIKYKGDERQPAILRLFGESKIVLGKGNFGVVKQISLFSNGQKLTWAVKRVLLHEPKIKKAVEREIKMNIEANKNDSVVRYYGCFDDFGYLLDREQIVRNSNGEQVVSVYIVMESLYMDFSENNLGLYSPYKILKKLDPEKKLEVYLTIAKTINSLHQLEIVHSDIKPENIMAIDENLKKVKLIDLGMSDFIDKPLRGRTLQFSSPESFLEEYNLDEKFDIYSFGISIGVLQFGTNALATRSDKFYKDDVKDVVNYTKTNIETVLVNLEKIPLFGLRNAKGENFTKIIASCLQYNYKDRISSNDLVKRLGLLVSSMKSARGGENKMAKDQKRFPGKSAGGENQRKNSSPSNAREMKNPANLLKAQKNLHPSVPRPSDSELFRLEKELKVFEKNDLDIRAHFPEAPNRLVHEENAKKSSKSHMRTYLIGGGVFLGLLLLIVPTVYILAIKKK